MLKNITWYDVANLSLITSCIILIFLRRRFVPNEIEYLLWYFILTLLLESLSEYFILSGVNNLFLYHTIIPFQSFLITYYLLCLLEQNKKKSIFIVVIIVMAAMMSLSFFKNTLSDYYSFASVIKNLFLSILILLYFKKIFMTTDYNSDISFNIWICTGLFINLLGNFFIEGSMNFLLIENRSIATKLYYLHISLDFLFYIVFIVSLLMKKKNNAYHKS